ncbi:MAG: RecQ family ATP-dependent DNA helicase [Acidobacteria bacterium]|nr:RecQ family ATP-dependent DNA helicase [Acidobacteriota bacterium]
MEQAPAALDDCIARVFGHAQFRPGQREATEALFAGRDVIAVMPTGAGKSLCYQAPALLLDGVTLVVSPLIALMKDQVDALAARGIAAAALHSGQSAAERLAAERAIGRGVKLLYVAPERLALAGFLDRLTALGVARMVVDEAHCISSWGHDFRPDYLRLGPLREALGVPAGAFTATATPDVRVDIARQLRLADPLEVVTGFERPNLSLAVAPVRSFAEKRRELARVLRRAGTPGIVYAATRKSVELWAAELEALGLSAGGYHAGLSDAERVRVQEQFLAGRLDAIAATNAFGMGIDKADIRFVVHADIPGSIEAYYQEAGRAGRDGRPSRCELLFSPADIRTQEFFLRGSNPDADTLRRAWSVLRQVGAGQEADELASRGARTAAQRMELATALRLLRQAADARGIAPGEGPLPLDVELREHKARRDRERLDAMIRYAFHGGCRTRYVYDYFAGAARGGVAPRCGACDVCCGDRAAPLRALDDDEYERVRIALSAVARLDGRFGAEVVALVLAGSAERKVKDRGLDALPTYGRLRGVPLPALRALLDALVGGGLVERRAIAGARAGTAVLGLSREGARVMRGETRPDLPLPPQVPPPAPPAPRGAPRRRAAAGSVPLPALVGSADPALLARLKEWRRQRAAAARAPAFTVFHDSVLDEIARTRPGTLQALAQIKGLGPVKLALYGEELIALLAGAPAHS